MKKISQERRFLDKAYQTFNLKGKLTNNLDPEQKKLFGLISDIDEKSRQELISGLNGKSVTKNLQEARSYYEKDNYLKSGLHIISIVNILLKVVELQNVVQQNMETFNLPEFAKNRFEDNGGDLSDLDSLKASDRTGMTKTAGLFDWFSTSGLYNLVNRDRWKNIFKEKNPIIKDTDSILETLSEDVKAIVKKFDELSGDLKRYDVMEYARHSQELVGLVKATDIKVKNYVAQSFAPFVKQVLPPETAKKFEKAVVEDAKTSELVLEPKAVEKVIDTAPKAVENILDQEITPKGPTAEPSHEKIHDPEPVTEPSIIPPKPEVSDDDLETELQDIVEPITAPTPVNVIEEEERSSILPEESNDKRRKEKFLEEKVTKKKEEAKERKTKKTEEKVKEQVFKEEIEKPVDPEFVEEDEFDGLMSDLGIGGEKTITPTEETELSDLMDDHLDTLPKEKYQMKVSEMIDVMDSIKNFPRPKIDEKKPAYEKAMTNGVTKIDGFLDDLLDSGIPFVRLDECNKTKAIIMGLKSNLRATIQSSVWDKFKDSINPKLDELISRFNKKIESHKKLASYETVFKTANALVDKHQYKKASRFINYSLKYLDKSDSRYAGCLSIAIELGK